MSVISVTTPFNIDLEFNVAPVGKRGLAFVIDVAVLVAYTLIIVFLLGDHMPDDEGLRMALITVLYILPVFLYHFLMEVFFSGQSIGKRALKIRVVNIMGNEASISQYLIRLLFRASTIAPLASWLLLVLLNSMDASSGILAGLESVFSMMFMLAMFIYYVVSKKGQRLGDRLADTLVIEDRATADIHKTIYLEIADRAYQVRYPEVMRLTDRDINGIRNLLDVKRITKDTEAYTERIATRITEVLHIETTQDSYDFLAQLLRDYNYLTSK